MFPNIDDQEEFVERIGNVCQVYKKAMDSDNTITVTSSDEKTGIQAINSIKTALTQKGRNKRNGTSCLMVAQQIDYKATLGVKARYRNIKINEDPNGIFRGQLP